MRVRVCFVIGVNKLVYIYKKKGLGVIASKRCRLPMHVLHAFIMLRDIGSCHLDQVYNLITICYVIVLLSILYCNTNIILIRCIILIYTYLYYLKQLVVQVSGIYLVEYSITQVRQRLYESTLIYQTAVVINLHQANNIFKYPELTFVFILRAIFLSIM